MNMQNIPQPPPMAQNNPEGHFYWYISQGFPYQMAYDLTAQKFGAPKSKEEQAREAAAAKEKAAWAGQAGQIAGGVVGIEAARNFPNVKEWLGYKPAGEVAAPNVLGAQRVGTPGAQAPATPKVLEVKGDVATVQTPAGAEQVPTEALNDSGFWSNIDWNSAAQGGIGALQLYQSYKALKEGDKVGAGIYGVGGAANIAASGWAGAGAQAAAKSTLGQYLVPAATLAAGLYGGYQTAEALSDMAAGKQRDVMGVTGGAAAGAAIGSVIPGVGTAIGAAVGATAGYLGSKFGSSKNKAQMMRDSIRNVMQEGGILDKDYKGTLADGSSYDFGKDGSTLKWSAIDKIAEAQPQAWDAAVPAADAIAAAYGFVGQKASDIAAWYAKAAVSNADNDPNTALANVQHFAAQQNLTPDLIKGKLDEALSENRIDQDKYNYYMTGVNRLFAPTEQAPVAVERPKEGEVARQSPGLYRNDQGNLVKADSMRAALEKAYKGKKSNKKSEEL